VEQLNQADKGPQQVCAHQPFLLQLLDNFKQGLQPMEVPPCHSVTPAGMGDGASTHEGGEWCVGIVPQQESYFLPSVRRAWRGEVELGIESIPRFDIDVHATQNCRFRNRA
jgi:hypothetical protein